MLRRSSELTPIGLDMSERSVRAVQLRRDRRSGAAVIGAATILRAPAAISELGPSHVAGILGTLGRQGFVGERVVLAVPQKMLLTAVLEVPPRTSGAPLDVICRNELARAHRLEPELIESAWWDLPAPPAAIREVEGAQAVAVGCRQIDAEALISVFESAGAEVCAIDARGPALTRAVAVCSPPAPSLTAVIEWDCEAALIVVSRAGTIVYERNLSEAGLAGCRAELVKKLAIDQEVAGHLLERIGLGETPPDFDGEPELLDFSRRTLADRIDSLALEFRASAAYASRRFGDSVAAILTCGDGMHIPLAAERLARRIEQPLTPASPQQLCPGSSELPYITRPSSLAAAIGLAAHPQEAHA